MKNLKYIGLGLAIVLSLGFSGCSKTAMPNLIAGKYYMAGDDNCVRYKMLSDSRIMCQDSDGKDIGYRDPMTAQEISIYQQVSQQQSAQFNQSLNNFNQQLQRQNEQMNYNNQQFFNRNNVYKFQPVNQYGY